MRASPRLFLTIVAGLLATGPLADAAENGRNGSVSREDLDRRVHAALYKVTCEGVDLFNNGQRAAAAFHFQAAATALEPFLDHRRDLQEVLQKALVDAVYETDAARRARILHKALVHASDETLEPMIRLPRPGDTLWQRLGEEKGVTRIVDDFVDNALRSPKINFTRNREFLQTPEQVDRLKRQLVELTSALGKGPFRYNGRSMQKIHEKMGITDAEFGALRMELHLALSRNAVRPEDVALILAGYDSTRPDIVTVKGEQPQGDLRPDRTLWEELGGEAGATKKVDEFVDLALKDKRVNLSRDGKYLKTPAEVEALKRQLVSLASAVGKGEDLSYKGRSMLDAHKKMGITDAEFNAFVEDLETVLEQNNVRRASILLLKQLLESKRKDIVATAP